VSSQLKQNTVQLVLPLVTLAKAQNICTKSKAAYRACRLH